MSNQNQETKSDNEDALEGLYWEFDDQRKKKALDERSLFKGKLRYYAQLVAENKEKTAPKRWTMADKEARQLPERGSFVRTQHLFDGKKRLEVMAAIFDCKGRGVVCLSDGEGLYNEWLDELLPDETQEELSQRLLNERIARMVALFEEKACHQTYNIERGIEAVVHALTKEFSDGKGFTWTAIVI